MQGHKRGEGNKGHEKISHLHSFTVMLNPSIQSLCILPPFLSSSLPFSSFFLPFFLLYFLCLQKTINNKDYPSRIRVVLKVRDSFIIHSI